jgi:phage recombination protein Bet
MNALAIRNVTPVSLSASQLDLIRKTDAKDCNDVEFDQFIAVAQALGLSPLRKQISAIVFNKNDDKKRNMAVIVRIDGLRSIAARQGDYRPMATAPVIDIDPDTISPANPLGIVRAEVTVWKRDGGEWFPCVGEAYWEEFAPIKDDCEEGFRWIDTGEVWEDSGKPKKKKVANGEVVRVLEKGNWTRMPRLMIAKCAEAQALRRGWPEQLSGVYSDEEMDRAMVIEGTATEVVAHHREEMRQARLGGSEAVMLCIEFGKPLERVERGKLADRLFEIVRNADDPGFIDWFRRTNSESLKQFWAWDPGDALEWKKFAEQREHILNPTETAGPRASPTQPAKAPAASAGEDRPPSPAHFEQNVEAPEGATTGGASRPARADGRAGASQTAGGQT